jgi:DNA-directed RNA polymerase specialized sigma24 family protein
MVLISAISGPEDPEPSIELLRKGRSGDVHALEVLAERYRTRFERWLMVRLPAGTLSDTEQRSFVRDTVIAAASHPAASSLGTEGALHAHLRQLLNRRMDESIAVHGEAAVREQDGPASPLEKAIGSDAASRYERSLASLDDEYQQAIILRLELGFSYEAIAAQLGQPDGQSARAVVTRAVAQLSDQMVRLK